MPSPLKDIQTLQQELNAQLKRWRRLLNQFRTTTDHELEFDLRNSKQDATEYINNLDRLKYESQLSLGNIQNTMQEKAGLKTSVKELKKINQLLERSISIREKMRTRGSAQLQTLVNTIHTR